MLFLSTVPIIAFIFVPVSAHGRVKTTPKTAIGSLTEHKAVGNHHNVCILLSATTHISCAYRITKGHNCYTCANAVTVFSTTQ